MIDPNNPCLFCAPDREIVAHNDRALAFADAYPVSPGHTLIVPRCHARTIFDLSADDYLACFELAREVQIGLTASLKPDGFNLGVNCGAAGGQSVWHAHIHLIPRFEGDVARPLGGVRNVIPATDKLPTGRGAG